MEWRKNILTVLCLKITWNILPKMQEMQYFCREIINVHEVYLKKLVSKTKLQVLGVS
jgi:hypothetical protein